MAFLSWLRKRSGTKSSRVGRQPTCKLRVEALEDRCTPASGPSAAIVADIVPGPVSSDPYGLTNVNGSLYFSTDYGLYKSDGTAAGTVLIKGDVYGSGFTQLNGSLLFYGSSSQGSGLQKTDGTAAGTVFLKSLNFSSRMTVANGKAFFAADDGNSGVELWVSDGTATGTKLVKDIYGGNINYPNSGGPGRKDGHYSVPHSSRPQELTNVNGTLYFTAEDGKAGRQLWRSDGTTKGTIMVTSNGVGQALANLNGVLYFGGGGGLWKSDGTAAGTVLVKANVGMMQPTNVNGTLFFISGAFDLWKTDGTEAGTVHVKTIGPSTYAFYPEDLTAAGGTLFFTAFTDANGRELWKSDGTAAGTVMVKDIVPGSANAFGNDYQYATHYPWLTNVNGTLYFTAGDTPGVPDPRFPQNIELWQSDGTEAGTVMVRDIYLGSTGSDPSSLVAMNNKLYFAATDPEHGRELWDPPAVEPTPGHGMTLVGNWHEHDHLYSDLWAEEITSGRFEGRTFAYLGSFASQGGVDIIDITNPSQPTLASTFIGTGGDNEIWDLQVQNGIGYFSSTNNVTGGIFVVDVSNPYAPRQLARIDSSNGGFPKVRSLFVDGPYLYEVANRFFPGVRVFDVSNPDHPSFIRDIPTASGEGLHEITVRNGRLYTANIHPDSGGEVAIFDVSNVGDLTRPIPLLGTFRAGYATHTTLATEDGQFLIVTHEWSGQPLEIYDISNPAAPKLASTIHLPRTETYAFHQPMIVGSLLYVASYEAGVRVYNIADPYHPEFVGDYDTYSGPYGDGGECAGLEGHAAGVNSDIEAGYGPLGCGAWGVYPFLGNDRILVSDFDHGLFVVSLNNPPAALIAASLPAMATNETLAANEVQPLLTEALVRWQAAGVDVSILSSIDLRIADLGGATLGLASGNTIWLDDNAAGWGWFVDPTPRDDSEFILSGDQGEQNHMDLLTVLEHELGHVLGYEHEADSVMTETLAAGTRPGALVTDSPLLASNALVTLLGPDKELPWLSMKRSKR